jgi:hypothetical protein
LFVATPKKQGLARGDLLPLVAGSVKLLPHSLPLPC